LALWSFSHKLNYFFAQVLALQNGLKLSFALIVIANVGDVVAWFTVIYLFSLQEKMVSYLPNLLSTCFKVTSCH
jgi:hypothetical protein